MPGLESIAYSRDTTVPAVRDDYAFLTEMYFDLADVVTPPEEGWPSINNLQCMGKAPAVLDTKLGIAHWFGCGMRYGTIQMAVRSGCRPSPTLTICFDWASNLNDDEAEWRAKNPA
ncbi:hypothetical protein B0H63DRAFT_467878 [Podospora didyma]|uniref:Uncharacterized protein n=1 Tax=Podospora didyma TaxID=330526 RepID=A0AAE0NS29_9PEZI|nr:hypothetical protein B0H63DRAFT_467878 [Podospora didyma]